MSGSDLGPCIMCAGVVQAMHRRAQKAEGELAKIGGEPGGLAYLRNEHYRRGDVDTENARLRAALATIGETACADACSFSVPCCRCVAIAALEGGA